MTRLGVTGHIHLTADTVDLIRRELSTRLRRYGTGLVGVSCLAPGADTIFAAAVLAAGGRLEVVLPARKYRDRSVPAEALDVFDELLAQAETVRVMSYEEPAADAYRAANDAVLGDIERLLAVWDGGVGGPGSTADTVNSARDRGIPVDIVWPAGARRA
ncbi:hypothetical protein [Nocardia brevicatena]|uniref:hypothetical protein n=1 Tax=Nocardia brevicatena TaxID=37327 RepID=UPI000594A080|nr:hypothetical protein [Nocardia brevicatena]